MYCCFQERTLGGLDIFLKYINDYVNTFMGKSITTFQWKDHLYAYFSKTYGEEKVKALDSVDWNVRAFPSCLYRGFTSLSRLGCTERVSSYPLRWSTI